MSDWSADGMGHFWRESGPVRLEANCRLRVEFTRTGKTTITILRIEDESIVGTATSHDWRFLTPLKSALEILMAEAYRRRKVTPFFKKRSWDLADPIEE